MKDGIRYELNELSSGAQFLLAEAFDGEEKLWSNQLRFRAGNDKLKPILFGEEIIYYGETIEDDPKGILFHLDMKTGEIAHQWTMDTDYSEHISIFDWADPYIIIKFGSHQQTFFSYDPAKRKIVWEF